MKNKLSDLKGLKKLPPISKLLDKTPVAIYEAQDDLYGSDMNIWMGDIIEIDGKIFPDGKGTFYISYDENNNEKVAEKEIKSFKSNDFFYTGGLKDDKREGQGVYTSVDGTSYVGGWKDNKREGQGTYTYADGTSYEGGWKGGNMSGQGKITYADGTSYEGEWKNGKKDGQGTYTYANRASYVGGWKDDKREGQGKITYADGISYEGEWKNGKEDGQGKITSANGASYKGGWKNGKKDGQGTYISENGDSYIGEWKNNIAINFSKIIIKNSKEKCHIITRENQSYFYQAGEAENGQEIDMDNEKRLKSVLLQFGNTISNREDVKRMKDSTELSEFIKSQIASSNGAKPSIHLIEIPEHAFTMLFEKGKAYCFDNGWLKNSSPEKWLTCIEENKVKYLNLPHEPNLKFQLRGENKTPIDIPIKMDTLQYCCRHESNVIFEKLEELKDELKENENLYDKFDEYFKDESSGKPKNRVRINSRCSLSQQNNVVNNEGWVNKVNIFITKLGINQNRFTGSKISL